MNILITPSKLKGTINIPMSKSICHRILICNFINKWNQCKSLKQISCSDICQGLNDDDLCSSDVKATLNGLLSIAREDDYLDCKDSGSTARFLLPLVLAFGQTKVFKCSGNLKTRPFDSFIDELNNHGGKITKLEGDNELLKTDGQITPGTFSLLGKISSQFASGLAMAMCTFKEPSAIIVNPPIMSLPYIALTLKCLNQSGFYIQSSPSNILNYDSNFLKTGALKIIVSSSKNEIGYSNSYDNFDNSILLEKDWSSAACWLVANYMGGEISIEELNEESSQGDSIITELLQEFDRKRFLTINCAHTPDLVPYLAIAACKREHPTVLENIGRLEYKESNRITAIIKALKKINITSVVQNTPTEKNLLIRGSVNFAASIPKSKTLTFDSFNDHRIAMSCAILASSLPCQSIITNPQCVSKSYPSFWDDFVSLGGKIKKV